MPKNYIIGFPRIGEKRELKFALERYWSKEINAEELEESAKVLRLKHWQLQEKKGAELISVNDFSYYDNMLDMSVALGLIPSRFKDIKDPLERYFTMARGAKNKSAMEMTKWFDTNYHYIVPELSSKDDCQINAEKIKCEYKEAKEAGITLKINIIGPITYLLLSKRIDGGETIALLPKVQAAYEALLSEIAELDSEVFVQIDEPVFVKDSSARYVDELKKTIDAFCTVSAKLKIIVATYFEHAVEAIGTLKESAIYGMALDLLRGPKNLEKLEQLRGSGIKVFAGVVDGRNIWKNDIDASLALLEQCADILGKENVSVSSSSSLLHLPYTVEHESTLKGAIKDKLSFAIEKLDEIRVLTKLFNGEPLDAVEAAVYASATALSAASKMRRKSSLESLNKAKASIALTREGDFEERITLQKEALNLPVLPTTTIGSFPQTKDLRALRKSYKVAKISKAEYEAELEKLTKECVAFQEGIGLDVLVHGEFERNDMVEYFGELLEGFAFTQNGWVQSYGSRCVKPPLIHSDVKREKPMTLKWITYAQSLTKKPLKGMLTGPTTIINWSFSRTDIAKEVIAAQIALALREEIDDLQKSGIKIVQVDEAAFKEGYPLRSENVEAYEKWAVENFRLSVSSAWKQTQIHTHMCYSEFNDIIKTIEAMDADVISIETSRSGNRLLKIFKEVGYKQEVGPGVYDIHSPQIPSVQEIKEQISALLEVLPAEKLWINPDCGLKTRKWEEVKPSLQNMVEAVQDFR